MSKSYRIRTKPGQENNGYINVNVDLNQNYDQLEILSLKISQKDDYQNFCSDYGVVAGRVIVNGGFGVPNVKVSVFVPVEDVDLLDPVKSAIYPYTEPFPNQKNRNGVRYNVLPKNQQSFDHTPVGTFPKKREVLDDNTTLEIYEKYYKYTTVTNDSGDYILFGIPVGDHFLHYDMDVSDIGFISVRPFELIDKDGYSDDLFDSRFKYKGSNNLDSLPQIFSENIPITVEPYWCDNLSVGSGLGINRYDIEPNISITPTAIFMGSIFSDDEKDSLNKNCKPSREMGKLNEVITGPGNIEAIRRTVDGNIETFDFNNNTIDDNGNWSVLVPMNIRKVVTDEFGNLVPSPDGIKGISTEGDYRFRITMDATSNDKRLRERAKYLVPNTNNNFNFDEYSTKELKKQRPFTLNEQLSTITDGTQYSEDITNQYNYLEEFFPFRWKKVYTVKQYIGRMQKGFDYDVPVDLGGFAVTGDESRGFIGIKDIINAEGVNKFPTNRTDTGINPIYSYICILLVLFGHVVGFINGIIQFINGLISLICDIQFPVGICTESYKNSKVQSRYVVQRWDGNSWDSGGGLANDEGDSNFTGEIDIDLIAADFDGNFGNCGDLEDQVFNNPTPLNGWQTLGSPLTVCNGASGIYCKFGDNPAINPSLPGGATGHVGRFPSDGNLGNNWKLIGGDASGLANNSNDFWCPSTSSGLGPNGSLYCYNFEDCWSSSGATNQCRRWKYADGNEIKLKNCKGVTSQIKKDECKDDPNALALFGKCWRFQKKCLFAGSFCKTCTQPCGGDSFSCCACGDDGCEGDCNDAVCGGADGGCCQGRCCQKIGLIPLKCNDEGLDVRVSLLNLSAFSPACNVTYVKPFACANCGGRQTPQIKDWASCTLEPIAVFLRMLKFDFYNDWVGGTLYFPLIKRKYKLKKSKRKFGQIKKDKFCDFECKERTGVGQFSENFQGNPTFKQHRIRITPTLTNLFPTITVGGCTARVLLKRATDWYGTEENDLETPNLDLAVQEFEFNGRDSNNEKCSVVFNNFGAFNTEMNAQGIAYTTPEREIQTKHGKPEYVETEDANGTSTWQNIGGHAHHRNICDNTKMIERKEYFKTKLDCLDSSCNSNNSFLFINDTDNPLSGFGQIEGVDLVNQCWEPFQADPYGNCPTVTCDPDCGSNGIAPCIQDTIEEYNDYSRIIKHGLISYNEGDIYYTPYIPNNDVKYNDVEYKANLMLPTTIMELGSSVYCDIDDVPFIMDVLPPTTFKASYEDIKYKFGATDSNYPGPDGDTTTTEDNGILKPITKFDDKKDISLNLRAYVEFACFNVVCENILAPVVQSQVGVDIIDSNDLGVEIGNCFVRFDHEDEVRDYFCKRFNGYKADDLSFHHQRPGSVQYENEYNTYQEISLTDGVNIYYELPDSNEIVLSQYNDGDSFIPGDGCGYRNSNGNTDYFYGVAPGQTSSFINYPNSDTYDGASGTINFGQTAQDDGIDEILNPDLTDDPNNGSVEINGIRMNRSQTPYYLYFGLVPGKTALHKTVGKFFADRIDAVTLQGLGASPDSVQENVVNTPGINNVQDNTFSVFRTCLGDTLIQKVEVGEVVTITSPDGQANNNSAS